ncbi:MAG TPA: co-chaperone GroES [Candidatus Saccharimonadales bacterium]|nr:co-chaperone GroES [Candidatus Saccharimonadales bacterium]
MSINIQPMVDYIVVQPEESATKTASGLYLPDSAQEKSKIAKVIAVGKNIEGVKVGDRVVYKNEYEATIVKIGNDEYTLVFGKNIIATVKK